MAMSAYGENEVLVLRKDSGRVDRCNLSTGACASFCPDPITSMVMDAATVVGTRAGAVTRCGPDGKQATPQVSGSVDRIAAANGVVYASTLDGSAWRLGVGETGWSRLDVGSGKVKLLRVSDHGRLLIADRTATLRWWSAQRSDRLPAPLDLGGATPSWLSVEPRSGLIVVGDENGTANLVSEDGVWLASLKLLEGAIHGAAFSPDGSELAVAGTGGSVVRVLVGSSSLEHWVTTLCAGLGEGSPACR